MAHQKAEGQPPSKSVQWAAQMTHCFLDRGMLDDEFLDSVASKIKCVVEMNKDLLKKAKGPLATKKPSTPKQVWSLSCFEASCQLSTNE